MKKKIELDLLRQAMVDTFRHYDWDITDYDVWDGIYHSFSDALWDRLDGRKMKPIAEKLKKEPEFCRHDKLYKKIIGNFYYKTPDTS